MAYQSYSAYHPNQSHSDALRPTINTSFGQNASYEPVHEQQSPDLSPNHMHNQPPFLSQHAYSSESVGGNSYYGAGTGGKGDALGREYPDDIPLRQHPGTAQPYSAPPGAMGAPKGPQPFVGEVPVGPEDLEREQRRQRRRREKKPPGILHRVAWVCWFMTLTQLAVFIAELVISSTQTGSPIQTKPTFNPMIGPSSYIYINMGARFVPCMKDPADLLDTSGNKFGFTQQTPWGCPNSTSLDASDPNNQCTLAELCGMGASKDQYPLYQWWRFITPIFLHAGIIHIGFNLLLQMTLGREIEHLIGSVRFLIVYLAAGIFGFVLGGNFAGPLIASVGCSGSLFGLTAISLLDLLYTWHKRRRPGMELGLIILEIIISFVLGLLPGLDNFAHIGGFLTGLVLGICILRSPDKLRKRIRPRSMMLTSTGSPISPTSPTEEVNGKQRAQVASVGEFTKKPLGFFQGRKPFWWAWWLVRAGCLIAVLVGFIVLLNSFYTNTNTCRWCRYLSCLPVKGWCDIGRTATNTTSNSRRDLFETLLTSGY